MAGVGVFELAISIEDAEKESGGPANIRAAAKKIIDVSDHAPGLLAQRERGECALQQRRYQSGSQTLAGHVRDHEGGAPARELNEVKIIAAHLKARLVDSGHLNVGQAPESFGQQRLLDIACDGNLALQALPLA